MKQKRNFGLKTMVPVLLCLALLIGACTCFFRCGSLKRTLLSQQTAERWRGENEQGFAQLSCFVPESEKLSLPDVYGVRTSLVKELAAAGFDTDADVNSLFTDCWYASGSVEAEGLCGKGTASVLAVGGNYFMFHPLTLLNGSYFGEYDFNQDTVLLDEELAWLLFGSNDLQGMELLLNGKVFAVSGVIERETDTASRKAYDGGMGLYMSYEAWTVLQGEEDAGQDIACYELVLAQNVEGAAMNALQTSFPVKDAEFVSNSTRFTTDSLISILKNLDKRSMQTKAVVYPYWENAARYVETRCALLLLGGAVLALLPVVAVLAGLFWLGSRGTKLLTGEVIPQLAEGTEERIRQLERKRWEKQHPNDKALLRERAERAREEAKALPAASEEEDEI